MIRYVTRAELDELKYNRCIETASQQLCYPFSWYLDEVCRWDALVLDDYHAVMPVPVRKKMGVSYVYPPLWILQLGVFSADQYLDITPFLAQLKTTYKFIEQRCNVVNTSTTSLDITLNEYQELDLTSSIDDLKRNFRKDRRKDLKRAEEAGLKVVWDDNQKKLITLFKHTIGKRIPNLKPSDYERLNALISVCIDKKVGRVLSVYSKEHVLLASAFILVYKDTVTILCSATDLNDRKMGANTYLIYTLIATYTKEYTTLNFGGSSRPSIASYFKSFGANTKTYPFVKYNNLPFLLRLFKH